MSTTFAQIFSSFLAKTAEILAEEATACGAVFPIPEPMVPCDLPVKKSTSKKKKETPQPEKVPGEETKQINADEILIELCRKSRHILGENFMKSAKKKTGLERKDIREIVARLRQEGKVRQEDVIESQ